MKNKIAVLKHDIKRSFILKNLELYNLWIQDTFHYIWSKNKNQSGTLI